jgi:hypothetical protein
MKTGKQGVFLSAGRVSTAVLWTSAASPHIARSAVTVLNDGILALEPVRETSLLRHLILEPEYLPRQARDGHKKG